MIIDKILDRRAGSRYTVASMRYLYDEAMLFHFFPLARALDGGEERDIKRELCAYIDAGGYNPAIKEYVNSVEWLPPLPTPFINYYY